MQIYVRQFQLFTSSDVTKRKALLSVTSALDLGVAFGLGGQKAKLKPSLSWNLSFWSPLQMRGVLLQRETPRRGGRQQPLQTLKKSKKYKGGKKHHTMVTQSTPKMLKWHHSALKACSILSWILGSRVDWRELMAFRVLLQRAALGICNLKMRNCTIQWFQPRFCRH
jgi:hypothetical protein